MADKNGKYLSKIYVKTYIKEKTGKESFYKDGYTDLRGRFDYASLSSSELNNAEKFSILIMSDTLGNILNNILIRLCHQRDLGSIISRKIWIGG